MSEPAISIKGLRMSYGETEAVRGIDLEVASGEILAFLGPNGAGKTSTVEILEGYRQRTGGGPLGAGQFLDWGFRCPNQPSPSAACA